MSDLPVFIQPEIRRELREHIREERAAGILFKTSLQQFQKSFLLETLRRRKGNKSKVAVDVGRCRAHTLKMLKRVGIQ